MYDSWGCFQVLGNVHLPTAYLSREVSCNFSAFSRDEHFLAHDIKFDDLTCTRAVVGSLCDNVVIKKTVGNEDLMKGKLLKAHIQVKFSPELLEKERRTNGEL